MKTSIADFIAMLLLVVLSACCTQAEQAPSPGTKIKIGIAIPLSGPAAWLGENTRNGIAVYLSQHPDFNNKFELYYEDVGTYKPSSGIGAIRKLIDVEKIQALLLENSVVMNAAAPILEEAKIPTIVVSGDNPPQDRAYMVKLSPSATVDAETVSAFLEKEKIQTVAVLTSEHDSMLTRTKSLKALLPGGIRIIFESTFQDPEGVLAVVPKIMQKKPEVVVMNLMPGQCGVAARKLRELGYRGKFLSTVAANDSDEKTLAQGALQGTVFPEPDLDPVFVAEYEKRFAKYPAYGAPSGHDAMMLFEQAFWRAVPDIKPDRVMQFMKEGEFKGAFGAFHFRASDHNTYYIPTRLSVVK